MTRSSINGRCECMSCTSITAFERVHMQSKSVITIALALYLWLGVTTKHIMDCVIRVIFTRLFWYFFACKVLKLNNACCAVSLLLLVVYFGQFTFSVSASI